MAKKENTKAARYGVKRPIPKLTVFKCSKCKSEISNENFAIDDKRDCPVCDNRDCLRVA